MIVADGLTRAVFDGIEFEFRPSFSRIAELGSPAEIVELYGDLVRGDVAAAQYVLRTLCTTDASPLTGCLGQDGPIKGAMPDAEALIIAAHLMRHGICGGDGKKASDGEFVTEFKVENYIAAAVVHFGITYAEAEALSMTQFQALLRAKYPEKEKFNPSQQEYDAFMRKMKGTA